MVRIEIICEGRRQIIACFVFPETYPAETILLDLKSRTLSSILLLKLSQIVEEEAKKYRGKPQIIVLVKFLKKFLEENPLIVCYDEISKIKKHLKSNDEIKLRQKNSTISLRVEEGGYFFSAKFTIPPDYFTKPALLTFTESNLPVVLERFLRGQALVISKQCSEPSATRLVRFKDGKTRAVAGKVFAVPQDPKNFRPTPSLEKIVLFLINNCREFVRDRCQFCKKQCLPDDPEDVERDEAADEHVERVYCGHLYHLQCLLTYMKTPPFQGGKKCPTCGETVCHDKWRISESLTEKRWAHEQARDRELQEIADFFQ